MDNTEEQTDVALKAQNESIESPVPAGSPVPENITSDISIAQKMVIEDDIKTNEAANSDKALSEVIDSATCNGNEDSTPANEDIKEKDELEVMEKNESKSLNCDTKMADDIIPEGNSTESSDKPSDEHISLEPNIIENDEKQDLPENINKDEEIAADLVSTQNSDPEQNIETPRPSELETENKIDDGHEQELAQADGISGPNECPQETKEVVDDVILSEDVNKEDESAPIISEDTKDDPSKNDIVSESVEGLSTTDQAEQPNVDTIEDLDADTSSNITSMVSHMVEGVDENMTSAQQMPGEDETKISSDEAKVETKAEEKLEPSDVTNAPSSKEEILDDTQAIANERPEEVSTVVKEVLDVQESDKQEDVLEENKAKQEIFESNVQESKESCAAEELGTDIKEPKLISSLASHIAPDAGDTTVQTQLPSTKDETEVTPTAEKVESEIEDEYVVVPPGSVEGLPEAGPPVIDDSTQKNDTKPTEEINDASATTNERLIGIEVLEVNDKSIECDVKPESLPKTEKLENDMEVEEPSKTPEVTLEHSKNESTQSKVEKEVIESEDSKIEKTTKHDQQIIREIKKQTTVTETVEELTEAELFEKFPELRGSIPADASQTSKSEVVEEGEGTFQSPKTVTSNQEETKVTASSNTDKDGATIISISTSSTTKQTTKASSSTSTSNGPKEEQITGEQGTEPSKEEPLNSRPTPPARKRNHSTSDKKSSDIDTAGKNDDEATPKCRDVPIKVNEANTPSESVVTEATSKSEPANEERPTAADLTPIPPPRAANGQNFMECCNIL